jgi:surfeit locus 1 family protein
MKYQLTFNPLMIFLTLVFFAVFTALSIWQVNRVYEKQHVQDLIAQANAGKPLHIQANESDQRLLQHRHYKATAKGSFLNEQCFFVENVIFKGKPGLYVYCPFRIEDDSRVLLVNMGWMNKLYNRLQLPPYQLSSNVISIEGVIADPRSKPVVTSGTDKPNIELDNLWAYFDFDSLGQQTGLDFYPIEFQLTTQTDTLLQRDWPEFEAKIGMHIGYAIHWAAFALATLGLFLKFNVKKAEVND